MLRYSHGNLLDAHAEALVNTVNEVGIMGKGIALLFKEQFPENTRKYAAACKVGEIKVGRVFVTENESSNGPKWIINFPTKKHWRSPSKLDWIRDGLLDLARIIRKLEIHSIAIPPLGCGNGGLDWRDVRPLIEEALGDIPKLETEVFAPVSHYLTPPKAEGVNSLTVARAMIAEITRRYSVLGMECSNLEIHKLAWFLSRCLDKLGVINPLRLTFVPHIYGPYSDNLRHLLASMDGSYLHIDKRISDAGVFDPISFNDSRKAEVIEFLQDESRKDYLAAIEATNKIIKGFESPLGMELLATVDWILFKERVEPSIDAVKQAIVEWPAGEQAAKRKLQLFDDRMLEIAIHKLAT